jgi:DNA-binding transcriptional regulator YiaG
MTHAILESMPKATPLADWIFRFRLHRDLTQADFARDVRVSTGTVQQWEYGTRTPRGPVLLLLSRLAAESGFESPPEVATGYGPRRPH